MLLAKGNKAPADFQNGQAFSSVEVLPLGAAQAWRDLELEPAAQVNGLSSPNSLDGQNFMKNPGW